MRNDDGPTKTTPYPESEKLAAVSDERRAILEFVEWCAAYGYDLDALNVDSLVMKFYKINVNELETERRAILAEARQR